MYRTSWKVQAALMDEFSRGMSAQNQSVSATLQVEGPPAGYISSTLAKTNEAGAAFFAVSGTTITLGDTSYQMQADSGTVKSGSTVTLKGSGGFSVAVTLRPGRSADRRCPETAKVHSDVLYRRAGEDYPCQTRRS